MTPTALLALALTACTSAFLTGAVRRYALAHHVLDLPNARSSHAVATPRGGGVAIVLVSLVALAWLTHRGLLPQDSFWALAGAGALVALVGFVDDHRHVAARWRLVAHFVAALWAIHWMGGMPPLAFPIVGLVAGWLGSAVLAVYLVWLLNLYNFMDGIDGIASVEAISVLTGGALLYVIAGQPVLAGAPLMLAAAVAGFLYWNVPPAKIFMGDAGSGFLGIVLGVLSVQAAWVDPELFWAWQILLGVFVVDATATLVRRLVRGERVYEAHRSHAYQYASRRLRGHLPVTLAVAVINIAWLLPIAVCVALGLVRGIPALVIAYLPLLALAIVLQAGAQERSGR